ncbi:MAG TPA: dihydrodipicolinate synthase family protein [Candidatus Paceibacterota bacterium]|nr:dihydrodipicolinate synthase family protein [Candidatus Paceibacterota bacterium]
MSSMQQVRGVCPVLSVPFTLTGEVDYQSFRNLVQWIISCGAESVLMFGVASENIKLDDLERDRLLEILVEEKRKASLTIVASVADHSLELAVVRARKYEAMGADFINILPPSFFAPSAEQILEHLRGILSAVKIPVIIQHLPQAGGMEDVAVLAQLAGEYENLAMIKCEANPPSASIERVKSLTHDSVGTLIGWGGIFWAQGVQAGALGVQPGCALTDAYIWAEDALDAGDFTEFERRLNTFIPWIARWISNLEQLIAVEKSILQRRGIIATAYCRRPTTIWDAEIEATLDESIVFLQSIGVHL